MDCFSTLDGPWLEEASPVALTQGEMGEFCGLSKLWRNLTYCPKKEITASPENLANKKSGESPSHSARTSLL